jgi:type II secretory pathway pseudopilin PulG
VEVLIAIAVVSLILAGAYATTNRSLSATRAAQEQGIALKLAEAQVEQIKGLSATNPDALFGTLAPTTFCISSAGMVVNNAPVSTECSFSASGTGNNSVEPIFRISITRSNNDTFTLTERWVDVGGRNTDQIDVIYRTHP